MDHFMFGEPPVFGFVLPVCARRFATKGSLVCARRFATKGSPVCARRFATKGSLVCACRFAPKKFIGLIPSVCARRPAVMLSGGRRVTGPTSLRRRARTALRVPYRYRVSGRASRPSRPCIHPSYRTRTRLPIRPVHRTVQAALSCGQ